MSWVLSIGFAFLVAGSVFTTTLTPPEPEWIQWPVAARGTAARWKDAFVPLFTIANVSVVVAVLVARRRPWLGTVLAAWPFVTVVLFGTTVWAWWLALAAVAVCAAVEHPRKAVVPYALSVGLVAVVNGGYLTWLIQSGQGSLGGPAGWWHVLGYATYTAAAVAVSAAIGVALRSVARTVAARATESHALVVESTASERARLARDLHDIVAHHVSLIAVRAESTPYALPDLSVEAKEVLREIAVDARSALGELRQVLTVLQRTQEMTLAPQKGAADVVALVAEVVAAGQGVELRGGWAVVPAAQGYVVYRAVQEGLTNARRHAPGSIVTLTLRQKAEVVGFRMTNPVPGPGGQGEPGSGLLGMRERVEALGGTVSAELEDDTFVLVVALPMGTP
ncbi:sensor histidine kinase [Cellulomonas sp. KRMCY2]|uniref:sensor histidine kinase n=1 Tax=Cellulomonas sp. KRMCY2 TaxID=1304865 RepID=UPI00045E8393|nr:histidine kinase [Cellulomonas sp. KRMCY2]